jgi:hypothetical protein
MMRTDEPVSLTGFGSRRIYYNNFAAHLLNSYNPNMLYPEQQHRWSDADWCSCIDMIADFGYNVFEFWLVPRLFCREALESDFGREFTRQMNVVCRHAHTRGVKVEYICSLATVGDRWHTYCPNVPAEWDELLYLWDQWTRRLPDVDIVGIFPGDPGACSRNGCTALTYIDKACEVAGLVKRNQPAAEITLHTWGAPIFGWGNIQGPPEWNGEFIQSIQHTAWTFDKGRADAAMAHLISRLPDFPESTSVAINLGFNPDGDPEGDQGSDEGARQRAERSAGAGSGADQDAREWARKIARTHRIETWDFSLTEGENNVVPHFRFERLFEQRRRERESAPYSGGICFTMSPMINQLSLWMAAQSFIKPDADPETLAEDFYERLFGVEGRKIVAYLPLFEVVKDWGNYLDMDPSKEPNYHGRMLELRDLLMKLESNVDNEVPLHPSPETYRGELLFFAQLFADLSGPEPDFDELAERYWQKVYVIYDELMEHVDPRPRYSTRGLIDRFRSPHAEAGPVLGKWS